MATLTPHEPEFRLFLTELVRATPERQLEVIRRYQASINTEDFADWLIAMFKGSPASRGEEPAGAAYRMLIGPLVEHLSGLAMTDSKCWEKAAAAAICAAQIVGLAPPGSEMRYFPLRAALSAADPNDYMRVLARHADLLEEDEFPGWLSKEIDELAQMPDGSRQREAGIMLFSMLSFHLRILAHGNRGLVQAAAAAEKVGELPAPLELRLMSFLPAFLAAGVEDEATIVRSYRSLFVAPDFSELISGYLRTALAGQSSGGAPFMFAARLAVRLAEAAESDPSFGPAADALLAALEEHAERASTDSPVAETESEYHLRRGLQLEQQGKLKEAIVAYEAGLEAAHIAKDRRAELAGFNFLGLAFEAQWNLSQAVACFESALDIAHELKDKKGVAGTLLNLAGPYMRVGCRTQAYEGLQSAIGLFHETGDRNSEGKALGMLGLLHQNEGDARAASACYEAALQCFRATGNRPGEVETRYNLGIMLQKGDHGNEAITHYEAGLRILREIPEGEKDASLVPELRGRRLESAILGNLGIAYRARGQLEKAIAAHKESLAIERALGDREGIGKALANLGLAQRETADKDVARASFREALSILPRDSGLYRQVAEWLAEVR